MAREGLRGPGQPRTAGLSIGFLFGRRLAVAAPDLIGEACKTALADCLASARHQLLIKLHIGVSEQHGAEGLA